MYEWWIKNEFTTFTAYIYNRYITFEKKEALLDSILQHVAYFCLRILYLSHLWSFADIIQHPHIYLHTHTKSFFHFDLIFLYIVGIYFFFFFAHLGSYLFFRFFSTFFFLLFFIREECERYYSIKLKRRGPSYFINAYHFCNKYSSLLLLLVN